MLERRETVGGGSITDEIHPGFRCSTLAHSAGPLLPQIARDLNLKSLGLEFIHPEVRVLGLNPNGPPLCLWADQARAVSEIEKLSAADAKSYPEFEKSFARIGRVLSPLMTMTPPSIDKPGQRELWNLGKLGLSFRGLGQARRVSLTALGTHGRC